MHTVSIRCDDHIASMFLHSFMIVIATSVYCSINTRQCLSVRSSCNPTPAFSIVGHRLATKLYIYYYRQIASYWKGGGDHRVGQ